MKKFFHFSIVLMLIVSIAISTIFFPSTILAATPPNSDRVFKTISVGTNPASLTFNSVNGAIYVTNFNDGTLSVINGATNTVSTTIPISGIGIQAAAYDPVNGKIFVINYRTNSFYIINSTTNMVTNGPISLGRGPDDAVYDSANGYIYVPDFFDNKTSVINGPTTL